MVKAELSYNPYLLETKIKFNGQKPRINSLVEKYQQETLQNWVKRIPSIFYDEMNGYDFELEFSGTNLEYEDLAKAFSDAGVTDDMVRLFHKNELDCRKSKTEKIDELMDWFEKNLNRKFDFASFRDQNGELFNSDYVCVMLNGEMIAHDMKMEYEVSLEIVDTVGALDNTSLFHTPIIIWIDQNTLLKMKSNLRYFFERKDVDNNQLFFLIQSELNATSIERTIKDLGIETPCLIESVNDGKIKRYLEIYPVSDYIYEAIKILHQQETEIATILDRENEENMISNREIHAQIDSLEDVIERLKNSLSLFVNRDNIDTITEMQVAKANFLNAIQNWKNRKTKITKEYEAATLAQDLDLQVKRLYQEFKQRIEKIFTEIQEAVELEYKNWYESAKYEMGFVPNISCVKDTRYSLIPVITNELLEMKEKKLVTPKEDLFGKFFKASSEKEVAPVLEVTFDCQKWRDYALGIATPIAIEIIQKQEVVLKSYITELAELYKVQLENLIKDRTAVKETVSAQLSDDEQKLQEDNDWLVGFHDQLKIIERG